MGWSTLQTYARVDYSERVHTLRGEADIKCTGDDGLLFVATLFIGNIQANDWQTKLRFSDTPVTFKLDTRAQANVLPVNVYSRTKPNKPLARARTVLTAFGDANITPVGETQLRVTCPVTGRSQLMKFFATDTADIAILGKDACQSMNLMQSVRIDDVASHDSKPLTKEDLLTAYRGIFTGTGMFEKEYHIELDPSVPPVIQAPCKGPQSGHHWEAEGSLRICLDPRPLNRAIKRERYEIPTPADGQSQLGDKQIFTVIDMKDGYWHVKLTEESSHMCTFHIPWGRKTFADIPGVRIIADDMIISAKDETEQDVIVRMVIQRARERNVKFNKTKVQFNVPNVTYMGHIVAADVLKPDLAKVEATVMMPKLENKSDLQRLLGMVRYLAQYIPNKSAITAPLRSLLKQDVEWDWQHEHDQALEKIHTALTSAPTLQYYDVNKTVTVQADASQRGLEACLLQQDRPVPYASRALTSA